MQVSQLIQKLLCPGRFIFTFVSQEGVVSIEIDWLMILIVDQPIQSKTVQHVSEDPAGYQIQVGFCFSRIFR